MNMSNSTSQIPNTPPHNYNEQEEALQQLRNYNKILLLEQQTLQSKLNQNEQLMLKNKTEMELKHQLLSENIELGK